MENSSARLCEKRRAQPQTYRRSKCYVDSGWHDIRELAPSYHGGRFHRRHSLGAQRRETNAQDSMSYWNRIYHPGYPCARYRADDRNVLRQKCPCLLGRGETDTDAKHPASLRAKHDRSAPATSVIALGPTPSRSDFFNRTRSQAEIGRTKRPVRFRPRKLTHANIA